MYGDIKLKSDYSSNDIDEILEKLYSTNFFQNVSISLNNGILKITVKEYDIINSILIEGEKSTKVKDGILKRLSLKEKGSFIKNNLALEDPEANMQIYPSGHGGGIFITDTAEVVDCKIVNNQSRRGGGGVAIDKFGILRNSIIFANSNLSAPLSEQPYSGGGVFISDHSFNAVVRNCRLTRNQTLGIGGGIAVDGPATVENCIFNYNYARVGGGGYGLIDGNVELLTNCTFYRNSASHNPNYSIISYGDLDIINCIVSRGSLIDRENNKFYSMNSTYSLVQEVTVCMGE